jgi:hypothetical protein
MAVNHGDLDPDTADRLLAGRLTSDDAPPGYGGVAQLLQRAHVDTGSESDVTDDELVVAIVNAIVTNDPARTKRNHVLTRIVTTKALVAAAVVALTATGAAAATGMLPDNAQNGLARAARHQPAEGRGDKARESRITAVPIRPRRTSATEPAEPDAHAGGAGVHGNATTPGDPASTGSGTTTPTTANHGAVVSQTAHDGSERRQGRGGLAGRATTRRGNTDENHTPPSPTAGGPKQRRSTRPSSDHVGPLNGKP